MAVGCDPAVHIIPHRITEYNKKNKGATDWNMSVAPLFFLCGSLRNYMKIVDKQKCCHL